MTLPAPLANLDADLREWAIGLAVEIAQAPEPIRGLTTQQARLVRVLQAAKGRTVYYDTLAAAIAMDHARPPGPNQCSVVIWAVRKQRPDIGAHIQTSGVGRCKQGWARWHE